MATAVALVGFFVIGGGVSSIDASSDLQGVVTTKKPTLSTLRTKNAALPTTVAPAAKKPAVTTVKPRVKNGVPKPSSSLKPKGS